MYSGSREGGAKSTCRICETDCLATKICLCCKNCISLLGAQAIQPDVVQGGQQLQRSTQRTQRGHVVCVNRRPKGDALERRMQAIGLADCVTQALDVGSAESCDSVRFLSTS